MPAATFARLCGFLLTGSAGDDSRSVKIGGYSTMVILRFAINSFNNIDGRICNKPLLWICKMGISQPVIICEYLMRYSKNGDS